MGMSKSPETIYLIDDDPSSLASLSFLLQTYDYPVIPFSSAKEALKQIMTAPPALVITDFAMPEENGISLSSKILDQFPDLPVILISAFIDESIGTIAQKAGIASFIEKPVNSSHLIGTLRQLLPRE